MVKYWSKYKGTILIEHKMCDRVDFNLSSVEHHLIRYVKIANMIIVRGPDRPLEHHPHNYT